MQTTERMNRSDDRTVSSHGRFVFSISISLKTENTTEINDEEQVLE